MKLVFTNYAWNKLLFFRDKKGIEISGFGISSENDPFKIIDFVSIKQEGAVATTDIDDEALAEHIEKMCDEGIYPYRCSRIWIHTHPGASAAPSGTDEDTFEKHFGNVDWAIMFILAKGGQTSCRLKMKVDMPFLNDGYIIQEIKTEYDPPHYNRENEWEEEYERNISEKSYKTTWTYGGYSPPSRGSNTIPKTNQSVGNGITRFLTQGNIHDKVYKEYSVHQADELRDLQIADICNHFTNIDSLADIVQIEDGLRKSSDMDEAGISFMRDIYGVQSLADIEEDRFITDCGDEGWVPRDAMLLNNKMIQESKGVNDDTVQV